MIRNGVLVLKLMDKQFSGIRLLEPWEVHVFEGVPEELPANSEESVIPLLRGALDYWNTEKSLENDENTALVRKTLETIINKYS